MKERFWAKTGQGRVDGQGQYLYHPVICHLADTATVAMAIVRDYLSDSAVLCLSAGLGLEGEHLIRGCGFLAGCHDLGKVSPAFQFQVSEVGRQLLGDSLYDLWSRLPDPTIKTPHGIVTALTLPEFLQAAGIGTDRKAARLARRLAQIVGGHHGYFPSQGDIDGLTSTLAGTAEGSEWQLRRFSETIFLQLQSYVGLTAADLPCRCDNAAAMLLAGLTTVSDWLASNDDPESGFPYANDQPFDEYATGLSEKAQRALRAQGWSKQPPASPLSFADLFPEIPSPRPLQEAAIAQADDLTAPCLMLVEAAMGEGKTEAALYLADSLQHRSGTGGFYIGLPTQATSNAMWERVRKFLAKRYPAAIINLTLSHSAAMLSETYQECRLERQIYDEAEPQGGRVGASDWHSARKRSLLSPYGVGTLDQALMGVVRSKHQFVRLFGLAGRTVILDEVHAYDLYTSTLLELMLEWLAVLGSPVIALSATLPYATRKRLVEAYARGAGIAAPVLLPQPYPRLTCVNAGELGIHTFAPSAHVCRQLSLVWVREGVWPSHLASQLQDGGCVVVICSTVNRAQEIYQTLQAYFAVEELGLFHGRFLFCDRARIEAFCLDRFGKDAIERPHRFVLVATQVVEQSLDLDFDLMISDLAPVDLLLQRSGRLHRHAQRDASRPRALASPTLWLIQPERDDQGALDFGPSGAIYHRHVLLRTWLALRQETAIALPDRMDELIESVYDPTLTPDEALEADLRSDWEASRNDYERGETDTKKTKAHEIALPPPLGITQPEHFTRVGEGDDDNTIARVTRLGDPSITVIFLQRLGDQTRLPISGEGVNLAQEPSLAQIRGLLAHSTRISTRKLVPRLEQQTNPESWTSALLRYCRLVEVDVTGCSDWIDRWQFQLDPRLGVVIRRR